MSKVFISYSRRTGAVAEGLAEDLEALGHTAWFDQELSGGQLWWDRILTTIRECDVVAVLLDPHTLNSAACQLEYEYGVALRKPILPILISDEVSTNLLPTVLSLIQFVDYRSQDRDATRRLARAFTTLPPPGPLPDPLPAPPEAPLSYLGTLSGRINQVAALTYEEQSALVVDLRRNFQEQETRDDARTLFERLRKRRDLFAAVAAEIDATLRERDEPAAPVTRDARAEEPHAATDSSPDYPNMSGASHFEIQIVRARWPWAAGAAVIGTIAIYLAIVGDRYQGLDWFSVVALLGPLPWAIAGAIACGRRQPTTFALVSAVVAGLVVGALSSAERSSTVAITAVGFGSAPAAIAGAIAGVVLERRQRRLRAVSPTMIRGDRY